MNHSFIASLTDALLRGMIFSMRWFSTKILNYLDFRALFVIILLCFASLLVISSNEEQFLASAQNTFFTPRVVSQLQWFVIGLGVYIFFACLDYNKLRELTWFLYLIAIILLIGLFFTEGSKNVQRWYKVPVIGMKFQPSEISKLILVMTLAWFLERNKSRVESFSSLFLSLIIVAIPFTLIYKQPDLGTALMLYPITLVMFYFGGVKRSVIKLMTYLGIGVIFVVLLFFLNIISHENSRPFVTKFLKEYQYERLNPNTHHQKAAQVAISVGGLKGTGWHQSEFTRRGWLPEAQTDSVFPAFVEEFGFIGAFVILALFYALIHFSFQVVAVAKDYYGCLLSAGITTYLAMHVIVNIGMMTGLLPITGVPLILVSYGGSSVLATMMALGILQSIYARRYMFSW
jgi:rod shape determining protein RodA